MIQINISENQFKRILEKYLSTEDKTLTPDDLFEKIERKPAEVKINCDGYYPYCDSCHHEIEGPIKNFCPTCGASFKKEEFNI